MRRGAAGFDSLPIDLQGDILGRTRRVSVHEVRCVCRRWEARLLTLQLERGTKYSTQRDSGHASEREVRPDSRARPSEEISACALAYAPRLRSVTVASGCPPGVAAFASRLLLRLAPSMPALTHVSLMATCFMHRSALGTVLARCTRLQALAVTDGHPRGEQQQVLAECDDALHSSAALQLPALCDLTLGGCPPPAACPDFVKLFSQLASMAQLTRLSCSLISTGSSHTETLAPVILAQLPSLTRLQDLSLFVGYGTSGADFSGLPAALMQLTQLSSLTLGEVDSFSQAWVQALAGAFCRLSLLTKLDLMGYDDEDEDEDVDANDPPQVLSGDAVATSEQLTASIGLLTRLQSLDLVKMEPFCSRHDCCANLARLVHLTHLCVGALGLSSAEEPGAEGPGGDAQAGSALGLQGGFDSLLSGLTALRSFELQDVKPSAAEAALIFTVALPRLTALTRLCLCRNAPSLPMCAMLASSVRHLPALLEVNLSWGIGPPESGEYEWSNALNTFDAIAGRDVFTGELE